MWSIILLVAVEQLGVRVSLSGPGQVLLGSCCCSSEDAVGLVHAALGALLLDPGQVHLVDCGLLLEDVGVAHDLRSVDLPHLLVALTQLVLPEFLLELLEVALGDLLLLLGLVLPQVLLDELVHSLEHDLVSVVAHVAAGLPEQLLEFNVHQRLIRRLVDRALI